MSVTQIQLRHDTAANWTSVNPILANGEIGVESGNNKFKIGDGGTAWNSLSYATGTVAVNSITGLGTGVATFLATPTSSNLAAAITNESGTGSLVFSESPSFTGTTSIHQILEKVTVSGTSANGTINYDLLTNGSVTYYTGSATGNWTLNIRGNSSTTLDSIMSTGQSLTVAFLVTNGATGYYPTALQVDGSSVTPKWQGGTAPAVGNANSVDIYTYTIIKTGSAAFSAFAGQVKFA